MRGNGCKKSGDGLRFEKVRTAIIESFSTYFIGYGGKYYNVIRGFHTGEAGRRGCLMVKQREIVLMMFSKKDAENAIVSTGRKVLKGKIVNTDGEPSSCKKCRVGLTVENLGRILPGSVDLYCDNPICFNDFSVKLV